MELSKLITLNRVRVPITATEKREVITELVDVLAETGGLVDRDLALDAVLKREAERTTGIGYGLAIPHGKSEGCRDLVMVAGKPAQPVDFQSLDQRPVTFVVLLLSPPDQTGPHIQALAKISRLMNIEAFREAIDQAQTPEQLHEAIEKFESHGAD